MLSRSLAGQRIDVGSYRTLKPWMKSEVAVDVPSDAHEREADDIAAQVMGTYHPQRRTLGRAFDQAGPSVPGHSCPDVVVAAETAGAARVAEAGGDSLSPAVRAFFEPRFGHDFSQVRIHHDREAALAAPRVHARAYTVGSHIVFAHGEYRPDTLGGRMLLAHELAHVMQQSAGTRAKGPVQVLQRQVDYVRQLPDAEAATFMKQFDDTIAGLEPQVADVAGQEGDDFRAALAQAKAMRAAGKVTFWDVRVTGKVFASYDNASGELRIHVNVGSLQESPVGIMHEAIHALHAERYPRLRQLYAQVLQAGGTKDKGLGILLLKWKAWTEYWAYRRQTELGSVISRACQVDVHAAAMHRDDVRLSVKKVVDQTGAPFDPSTWSPPTQYLAPSKPGQPPTPVPGPRSAAATTTGGSGQQETVTVDKATTLTEFAERTGFDATCLRRFNPDLTDPNALKAGDQLWLLQRSVVPAGPITSLMDFCRLYLGKPYAWPKVWAANPQITEPTLKPTDKIRVPQDLLTPPFVVVSGP